MSDLRAVIIALAAALIMATSGIIALAVVGQSVPDVLQAIATAALGALGGLMVPARDLRGSDGTHRGP